MQHTLDLDTPGLAPALVALPGPGWAETEPYRSEQRDGRPRSCPMQIMVDGRVWRYVGGLLTGEPQYAPQTNNEEQR